MITQYETCGSLFTSRSEALQAALDDWRGDEPEINAAEARKYLPGYISIRTEGMTDAEIAAAQAELDAELVDLALSTV